MHPMRILLYTLNKISINASVVIRILFANISRITIYATCEKHVFDKQGGIFGDYCNL